MKTSVMWEYISEESAVLTAQMQSNQTDKLASDFGGHIQAVYLVAHGSSYNAAVCMAGFFTQKAGIRAYAYTPGNFYVIGRSLVQEPPKQTLVVVISQTGTSAGALHTLEYARSLGYPTIGITQAANSPVAKTAEHTLYLLCGGEDSNAKTKGYSATLLMLLQLAISLGAQNETLKPSEQEILGSELRDMIGAIPEFYENAVRFCEKNVVGKSLKHLFVLGSGMNFGSAQEAQLKLMETMCIPTMFNDIGEFSHGMHRAVTVESSILLLRSADRFVDEILQAYEYLKGLGATTWMLDASGSAPTDESCLNIPMFPNTQSILLVTLAIQVLSAYIPEQLGLDPNRNSHDDFTHLAGTRV